MLCSISTNLDSKKIENIQRLEKEIGKTLLAYSCHDSNAAKINDEQLNKVKSAEKDLGIVLVAID